MKIYLILTIFTLLLGACNPLGDNSEINSDFTTIGTRVPSSTVSIDQIDDDDSASGFGGGTHLGTTSASGSLVLNSTINNSSLDSTWTPKYSSLIGYWKLDNSLLNEINSVGGSLLNGAGYSTTAKVGTHSVELDGTNDEISLGTNVSPSGLNKITISAWAKADVSTENKVIGGWWDGANGIFIQSRAAGGEGIAILTGNGNSFGEATVEIVDEWFLVTLVYDGTLAGNANRLKLYINGIQQALTFSIGTVPASMPVLGNDQLLIGDIPGLARNWNGKVDEFAIWSEALTQDEINIIYNRQKFSFSGIFESRVIGSDSVNSWTTLSAKTSLPFYKELPGNVLSENTTDYSGLNSNTLMTDNEALWHLNEPSWGGVANEIKDQSGNGNDGVRSGDATTVSNGAFSRAGYFDGTGDYAEVGSTSSFNFIHQTGVFSLSLWVNLDNGVTGEDGFLGSGPNGTDTGFYLSYVYATKKINFVMMKGSLITFHLSDANALTVGKWHHIAVVGNGTETQLYVNGAAFGASKAFTVSVPGGGNATRAVTLGGMNFGPPAFLLNGRLDEVGIWSRVLSAAEILTLYRRGANRVNYQVRSCSSSTCAGVDWKGPDGSSSTFYSELHNVQTAGVYDADGDIPVDPLSLVFSEFNSIGSNKYFQYKAFMESDDTNTLCTGATCYPEVQSITIGPSR